MFLQNSNKMKCMSEKFIWGPAGGQKHRAGTALLPPTPLK